MQPLPTQETPKAAAAYAAYEAIGEDRSFAKLAKLLYGDTVKNTSKIRQLSAWSAKYHWQDRVQAHDATALERERTAKAHADAAKAKRTAEREAKRENAREIMDDERAELMRATWRKVLGKIDKRLDDGETRGLVGMVSLLKHAMDEERLARGGATAINEQRMVGKDGGELAGLTIFTSGPASATDPRYVARGTRPTLDNTPDE